MSCHDMLCHVMLCDIMFYHMMTIILSWNHWALIYAVIHTFSIVGPILAGAFFIFKFAVYWKMQFISAGIVTGIPAKSSVVEVDALDGKNIFYLPKDTDYTAVMSPGRLIIIWPPIPAAALFHWHDAYISCSFYYSLLYMMNWYYSCDCIKIIIVQQMYLSLPFGGTYSMFVYTSILSVCLQYCMPPVIYLYHYLKITDISLTHSQVCLLPRR